MRNEPANDGVASGNPDGGNTIPVIEPSDVATAEPERRGRGRPRKDGSPSHPRVAGTERQPAEKKKIAAVGNADTFTLIAKMLSRFAANITRRSLIALDDEESKMIGEAAFNVRRHYDLPVSPKQEAWLALATTVGMIYQGKIIAAQIMRTSGGK